MSSTSEKLSLLPITEHAAAAPPPREPSRCKTIESVLVFFCMVLAALQFLVHFNPYGLESRAGAQLDLLARGFCVSIPASLPMAAILFAAAPWIARPDSVAVARYAVLLCYLVGSSLGAWFLTRHVQVGLEASLGRA